MSSDGVEVGTLAGLVERLAAGFDRPDEAFARRLAAALHERAAHVSLPQIEAMGLEDVVVTFYMDDELRLVVTGNLGDSGGQASVRWPEGEFGRVSVAIHEAPLDAPYLFATLDFSVRGRQAVLTRAAPPLPAGLDVTLRCLSTVGGEVTYRVAAHGREASAPPDALSILDPDDPQGGAATEA